MTWELPATWVAGGRLPGVCTRHGRRGPRTPDRVDQVVVADGVARAERHRSGGRVDEIGGVDEQADVVGEHVGVVHHGVVGSGEHARADGVGQRAELRLEALVGAREPDVDRALDGVDGTTAVHICFGYAAVVKDKPSGYSFLAEFERSAVDQVSIEAAQPRLDLSVLRQLPSKSIILGVIDLADSGVETPQTVADRIRAALPYAPAERLVVAPDCGLKYLAREVAFGKMRAMTEAKAILSGGSR